jgi:hypothetical protein
LLPENLAISRHLLRVENRFDLLIGAIPDGAHLGRLASGTAATRGIRWRTAATAATTPAPTAATSTARSTATSTPSPSTATALTAPAFSEGLHVHGFVSEDRADSGLLRGIEL